LLLSALEITGISSDQGMYPPSFWLESPAACIIGGPLLRRGSALPRILLSIILFRLFGCPQLNLPGAVPLKARIVMMHIQPLLSKLECLLDDNGE
jgi:hypothetical protein